MRPQNLSQTANFKEKGGEFFNLVWFHIIQDTLKDLFFPLTTMSASGGKGRLGGSAILPPPPSPPSAFVRTMADKAGRGSIISFSLIGK